VKYRAKGPAGGGPGARIGTEWTEVRIPRAETEEQHSFLEEELLAHLGRHSSTTWVIDLSEHMNGVTLALAGILARFREEAQRRGCEVKYTGLMQGCVSCLTE
jgi:hypothetical protein